MCLCKLCPCKFVTQDVDGKFYHCTCRLHQWLTEKQSKAIFITKNSKKCKICLICFHLKLLWIQNKIYGNTLHLVSTYYKLNIMKLSLFQVKYSVWNLFCCLFVCSFPFRIITYIYTRRRGQPLDHQSSAQPTELSHYLVVSFNN